MFYPSIHWLSPHNATEIYVCSQKWKKTKRHEAVAQKDKNRINFKSLMGPLFWKKKSLGGPGKYPLLPCPVNSLVPRFSPQNRERVWEQGYPVTYTHSLKLTSIMSWTRVGCYITVFISRPWPTLLHGCQQWVHNHVINECCKLLMW